MSDELDLAVRTYGADASGLICGFQFSCEAAGVPVDTEHVLDWLSRERQNPAPAHLPPGPAGPARPGGDEASFLWLHFDLAHSASERWLRTHLDLPEAYFEILREGTHSTRIERQDDALLALVNDVLFDNECVPTEVATMWVYTHHRIMVSARLKPLRSVDKLRTAVRAGAMFRSPVELLVHLLHDQADLLIHLVRRTGMDIDRMEDRFLASRSSVDRFELGALRRVLVRLQRMLAPEPGAIFRLLAKPPGWLLGDDVQELHEATEEFSVVLRDLASLVERIRLLQEEIASRLDEQNNRTLFTLTLVTVLALPINIIAGIFGMNVGGIPLAQNSHGFWLLVLLVASFTTLAGAWVFRNRKRH